MAKSVEFLFDVGSPTAYLAYTQMPTLAERTGAEIVWVPILLGGVFHATGNASPVMVPAKGKYYEVDIARCARHLGVPFRLNPYFVINSMNLMRGAVATQQDGGFDTYCDAVFTGMWVDGLNMGDAGVVAEVLTKAGLDAERILARTGEQEVKDKLKENTSQAVERGAFGAPSFLVGNELFFGHDRLDYVERALTN